ncbi:hypothetical protein GX48_08092 [Paracoccidioides brasiliensis]|nr:hypothetical protein GX48_08092 [Paracoccidioides brasiliensis]
MSVAAAAATASTSPLTSNRPFTMGTTLKSDSGKTYKIENMIVDRRNPPLCVYRPRLLTTVLDGEF